MSEGEKGRCYLESVKFYTQVYIGSGKNYRRKIKYSQMVKSVMGCVCKEKKGFKKKKKTTF